VLLSYAAQKQKKRIIRSGCVTASKNATEMEHITTYIHPVFTIYQLTFRPKDITISWFST